MRALRFERSVPRYAAAIVAGRLQPGGGARYGPLALVDETGPVLPGADWVRLRPRLAGICGSDLSTVDGAAARYFEPIVSFPFVPGHEVVADLDGADGPATGARVVLEPVLGCVARAVQPPCPACARGDLGDCERVAFGAISPGLQTGFCCDTGGGWSTELVAHRSQLHPVPVDMSDEAAVMVEPTACAVHAALRAGVAPGDVVAVVGAGTLGLTTLAALRRFAEPGLLLIGAKHPAQRHLAADLGADVVGQPHELIRAVRRATGSLAVGSQLTGGADVVVDCVGSSESLTEALQIVRPRGRVVLVGMPATVKVELTSLWHREVDLRGAYAYGTESVPGRGAVRTFELAFELVQAARLERLVTTRYTIDRFEDAIAHAAQAGRRGAVKIVFDLRSEKDRYR